MTVPFITDDVGPYDYLRGIDPVTNEPVWRRPKFHELDQQARVGAVVSSSTEITIGKGRHTFALDADVEQIKSGDICELLSLDQDNLGHYMTGTVLSKGGDSTDPTLTILVPPGGFADASLGVVIRAWSIATWTPMPRVIGLSTTDMAIPAVGQQFTINLDLGGDAVLVGRNVSLKISKRSNLEEFFRIRVLDFDPDGDGIGDCEAQCTAMAGSGSTDDWVVELIPGPVSGGGAAPASIVKQADATSSAETITAPADIQAGDLLVLYDRGYGASGSGLPATVVPSGFSVAANTTYSDAVNLIYVRQIISCKIADGSEASASLSGMPDAEPGTDPYKILLVFRPDVPAASFAVNDASGEATIGNPAAQTITASGGDGPLVVLGAYSTVSGGTVDPRTFTVAAVAAKDGEVNVSTHSYLAWKIYDSAPADVVVDMEDENAGGNHPNILQGLYIELSVPDAEPGDIPVFEDDGSGGPMYPAGDGSQLTNLPETSAARILTSSTAFTTASTVDIALPALPTGFTKYVITVNFTVATDAAELFARVNDGGGVDSGGSDYAWHHTFQSYNDGVSTLTSDGADSEQELCLNVGNATGEGGNITLTLCHVDANHQPSIQSEGVYRSTATRELRTFGSGMRLNAQTTTAIQLLPSAGTISGNYTVEVRP